MDGRPSIDVAFNVKVNFWNEVLPMVLRLLFDVVRAEMKEELAAESLKGKDWRSISKLFLEEGVLSRSMEFTRPAAVYLP